MTLNSCETMLHLNRQDLNREVSAKEAVQLFAKSLGVSRVQFRSPWGDVLPPHGTLICCPSIHERETKAVRITCSGKGGGIQHGNIRQTVNKDGISWSLFNVDLPEICLVDFSHKGSSASVGWRRATSKAILHYTYSYDSGGATDLVVYQKPNYSGNKRVPTHNIRYDGLPVYKIEGEIYVGESLERLGKVDPTKISLTREPFEAYVDPMLEKGYTLVGSEKIPLFV